MNHNPKIYGFEMESIETSKLLYFIVLLVVNSPRFGCYLAGRFLPEPAVARSRQVCICWLWKHCLSLPILPGDEQILIHIRKPCRSRTYLVRIAGPCPAVPVQLVPAQLGLSPAGPYQLWCTSLRIATDTRPTRNTCEHGVANGAGKSSTGRTPKCTHLPFHHPDKSPQYKQRLHNQFYVHLSAACNTM